MDDGISFVVRIRNEEETLEQSIRSLFGLRIPHEILLILHLCTDRSKEIAERLAGERSNIRIFEYTTPVSRPGYETLCTDRDSPHSLPTYYKTCYDEAVYPWKFKWDADFIATDGLIEYINSCGWCRDTTKSHELYMNAVSPDGTKNCERYIVSGNINFDKYWFWEVVSLSEPITKITTDLNITHQSKLSTKKSYWNHTPWFLDREYLKAHPEHYDEAIVVSARYIRLIELCGPEPHAQARASNPESTPIFTKVLANEDVLKSAGINAAL